MLFFLFILLASLAVAHVVGWMLVQTLEVEPGHIRDAMPTIPVAPLQQDGSDRGWRQEVRRVEGRLVETFANGVTQVAADELAADLSEDRRVVAGALERMREEVDCRIQVTRSGKILHDFSAEQIEKLRAERARSTPTKLFMLGVAAASNIGAIWPVAVILFLAVASLQAMSRHVDGAQWGLYGLGMIVAVFGATFMLSTILHAFLSPQMPGPDLGTMLNTESTPDRRASTPSSRRSDGGIWVFFGGGRSSSSSGGSFDSDSGGSGMGQALIAIVLIAIIVLCLVTIYIWVRGLWRAVSERNDHLDRVSPSVWVRPPTT